MSKTMKKTSKNRTPLGYLFMAAIVFGFLAGLGGSLMLSHTLIHKPLQAQHEENMRLNLQLEQKINELNDILSSQHEQISELESKIEYILIEDSSSYVSSLYALQKDYEEKEKQVMNRLTHIEQHQDDFRDNQKIFETNVDEAKEELERVDRSISNDIRDIKSSINDLETKLRRLLQSAGQR